MTYFPDGSDYEYFEHSMVEGTRNVGWLEKGHDFKRRVPDEELLERLWRLCWISVAQTRGFHLCDFCPDASSSRWDTAERDDRRLSLGTCEIRVFGSNGEIFAAPSLIYHYVEAHHYCPPDDFVEAVMKGPIPPEEAYFALLEKHALEWRSLPESIWKPIRFVSDLGGVEGVHGRLTYGKEVVLFGGPRSSKSSTLKALAEASPKARLIVKGTAERHRGIFVQLEVDPVDPGAEPPPPPAPSLLKKTALRLLPPKKPAADPELKQELDALVARCPDVKLQTSSGHVFYWQEQLLYDLKYADEIICVVDVQPIYLSSDEAFTGAQNHWIGFITECKKIYDELGDLHKEVPWFLAVTKVDLIPEGVPLSPRLVGWPLTWPFPDNPVQVSAKERTGLSDLVRRIGRPDSESNFRDFVSRVMELER